MWSRTWVYKDNNQHSLIRNLTSMQSRRGALCQLQVAFLQLDASPTLIMSTEFTENSMLRKCRLPTVLVGYSVWCGWLCSGPRPVSYFVRLVSYLLHFRSTLRKSMSRCISHNAIYTPENLKISCFVTARDNRVVIEPEPQRLLLP